MFKADLLVKVKFIKLKTIIIINEFPILRNVINNNLKGKLKFISLNNLPGRFLPKILKGYKELGIDYSEGILTVIIKNGVRIININCKLIK